MNTPENREYTAEIMFETFNVPGMYIGVQVRFVVWVEYSIGSESLLRLCLPLSHRGLRRRANVLSPERLLTQVSYARLLRLPLAQP